MSMLTEDVKSTAFWFRKIIEATAIGKERELSQNIANLFTLADMDGVHPIEMECEDNP